MTGIPTSPLPLFPNPSALVPAPGFPLVGAPLPGSVGAPNSSALVGETASLNDTPRTAAQALLELVAGSSMGIVREVEPTPEGGYETVERLYGPRYQGSYQSVTGPDGTPVERRYESSATEQYFEENFPGPNGPEDTFRMLERELTLQESVGPDGQPVLDWSTRDKAYLQNRPQYWWAIEASSESDLHSEVDHEGYERRFSPPHDFQAPGLIPGSPLQHHQSETTRPDGSLVRSEVVSDAQTGYSATETVVVAADGQGAVRTIERFSPAEEPTDDLNGWSVLGAFGHDSAQVLFDRYMREGPVTQQTGVTTTEVLDAAGNVVSTSTLDSTTWSNEDGTRTLTMIERGEGVPAEYILSVKEGDQVSTQRFVEGTEDTEIKREFIDELGFETVEIDTRTPEGANRALDQGAEAAVEQTLNTSRHKAEATVDDLRALLGEDYQTLAGCNPEFAALVQGLEGSTFGLMEISSDNTVLASGGQRREESHRALGVNTPEGVRTLTQDPESGEWSLSEPIPTQDGAMDPQGQLELVRQTHLAVAGSVEESGSLVGQALDNSGLIGGLTKPLQNLGYSALAGVAKGMGLAGNAFLMVTGAMDLANGDLRGAADLASGLAASLGLLNVISGGVAIGVSAVAMGGVYLYNYIDGTDMAEPVI